MKFLPRSILCECFMSYAAGCVVKLNLVSVRRVLLVAAAGCTTFVSSTAVVRPSYCLNADHQQGLVDVRVNGAIDVPDPMTLTNGFLLRQAASIALESSLNVLNRAVVATLDAHDNCQKVTSELVDLMEKSLAILGHEFEQDRLWELIVACRSLMDDRRKIIQDCDALMASAIKLVTSAAETAFTVGCHDYLPMSASERIYFAEREVNVAKEATGRLDEVYIELNARSVKMTSEHDQRRKAKLQDITDHSPPD